MDFITKKDEVAVKKWMQWYEKTDMKRIFFFPLIKGIVFILLYLLCGLIFKQYNFGYWLIFALGFIFSLSFGFGYLPLLGATFLNLKINYFLEARKVVDQDLNSLLDGQKLDDNGRCSIAKIKYSLGLLDEAEAVCQGIVPGSPGEDNYRSLLRDIDNQRQAIRDYESKGCKGSCRKG